MNLPKSADIESKISNVLERTQYFNLVQDIAQIYIKKYEKEASRIVSKLIDDCDTSNSHGASMQAFWKLVQEELSIDSN